MMYEHAEKIRGKLLPLIKKEDRELVNTIIEFGRVAKFRCRSNAAYKNFVTACFKDIAEIREVEGEATKDGRVYTFLQAVIK